MLDMLEEERRCVRLTLSSGEILEGYSDYIFWQEDDEGWETIKTIWFRPRWSEDYYSLREDQIKFYEVID